MALENVYRKSLWDVYARSISLVTVATLIIAFVVGGYDIVKLARPSFTLSSALQEKYKSNESYTEFGTFKKGVPEDEITREREMNYQKLLRMERQNALQRLAKVGLALLVAGILNLILVVTYRRRGAGTE